MSRKLDALVAERVEKLTLSRSPVNAVFVEGEWSIYPASEDRTRFGPDSGWMCYSGHEPAYVSYPDMDLSEDDMGDGRFAEEHAADIAVYGYSHYALEVVPRYHDDMNAALGALETAGWEDADAEWHGGTWVWRIFDDAGSVEAHGVHEHPATALCLALLRAAGADEAEIAAAMEDGP